MNNVSTKYPFRLGVMLFGVATAIMCTAAHFWPGVSVLNVASLLLVTFAAVFGIRYTPLSCRGSVIVMATTATLLGIGIILNTWYFTTYSGGTLAAPVLHNWDADRVWNDAIAILGDPNATRSPSSRAFFGPIIAGIMSVFGRSIAVAIIPGAIMLTGALVLTGLTTLRLGADRRTAVTAMASTAAVCYWLASGMILLKDAYIIFGMAMAAYALVRPGRISIPWYAAAVLLILAIRPNYVLFLVTGLACVPRGRECRCLRAILAMITLALWILPVLFDFTPRPDHVFSASKTTGVLYNEPQHMAHYAIVGDYSDLTWYVKLALMPLSAAVQFMIPFPWNFARDIPFGISQVWAHLGYCWYIFGGVLMCYLVQVVWRRPGWSTLLRLTLWGIFCWLVPCYIDGGTISRYGLPAVAIMAPAVAVTLVNHYRSRHFIVAMTCWAILIACTLIICYHLQHQYL